jgi:multidrug efflux system outer membrane protein
MKPGRRTYVAVFAAVLSGPLALAQAPTPATTPLQPNATPSADEMPAVPAVEDPMLLPVPPPHRFLASWDEAERLLRARSTDLRSAYDDIRRAEADSRTALAAVLPTLSASGSATHTILTLPKRTSVPIVDQAGNVTSGGSNAYSASLRASISLINFQVWHQLGTAHAGEDAARLSYQDLERTTAAGLATAIAQSVTAERVSELSRVGLRNALERLALTQAKERTGTATGLDIVRARQDVASARSSLVNSDEALRKSRESLGLAVGYTDPIGVLPSTDLSSIERSALKSCHPLPDLEHRPDVLAANKNVEITQRRASEVDLGFLPTLSAGSTLGTSFTDASNSEVHTTWNIQAILTVPIWDGGVRYGARRSAAAAADQSAASLEALRRNSTVGLAQVRRSVDVAEESRHVAQESRDLAYEVDRLTRLAYQTGKGTSLDLVTSAAALRQAEVNLAVAELGLVQARLDNLLTLANCSVAR